MPIQVQLKRSTAAGVAPTTLADGELAINTADSKLFFKDSSATIQSFTLQPYATPGATNVSRVVSLNGLTGTLTIAAGSNVTVSTAGSTITIAAANDAVSSVNGKTGAVVLTNTSLSAAAASHTHNSVDITVGNLQLTYITTNDPLDDVLQSIDSNLGTKADAAATNVSRVISLNTITGAMSIVAGSLVSVATAGTAITISGTEEVVEYLTTSVFPATGNTSLLYLATDASRSYRWTGSEYVEVGPTSLSGGSSGGSSAGSRALTFLLR